MGEVLPPTQETDSSFLARGWVLTHSGDGPGEGEQAPGVGREEPPAPEDARREAHDPLKGDLTQILPRICGKGLKFEDVILPKGVHRYQGGPGKGQREREKGGQASGFWRKPQVPPHTSRFQWPRPFQADDQDLQRRDSWFLRNECVLGLPMLTLEQHGVRGTDPHPQNPHIT